MHFVTIANDLYASRVCVLHSSVAATYPDALFTWVVSSVELTKFLGMPFRVRHGSDFVSDWAWRSQCYDETERATSIKAAVILAILDEFGEDVVYLDPDTFLQSPLTGVEESLRSASIVITPHWVSAEESAGKLQPRDLSRVGVINLGFIAASCRHPESRKSLTWLHGQTRTECIRAQEQGIFVDQRWADFLPSLFADVKILRDTHLNVGWWNGHSRDWSVAQLIHFSGYAGLAQIHPTTHLKSLAFADLHSSAIACFQHYGYALQNVDIIAQEASVESPGGRATLSLPYPLRLVARQQGGQAFSSVESLLLSSGEPTSTHPFDSSLGRALSGAISHQHLTCDQVAARVTEWLSTSAAREYFEYDELALRETCFAWQKIVETSALHCKGQCVHEKELGDITSTARDCSVASRERCECGRAKPGRFY